MLPANLRQELRHRDLHWRAIDVDRRNNMPKNKIVCSREIRKLSNTSRKCETPSLGSLTGVGTLIISTPSQYNRTSTSISKFIRAPSLCRCSSAMIGGSGYTRKRHTESLICSDNVLIQTQTWFKYRA